MNLKILMLGANGFIGNRLIQTILEETDWDIYGLDIALNKLQNSLGHKRFQFMEGDINVNQSWIEEQMKNCDIVLPLVAVATPATYVTDPIRVFELDFESNLKIIRLALQHNTRVIFPSTSEVYGMSDDTEFNEETSHFVQGPISKERWIYACSKQLLDRVIYAYGNHDKLQFSLFRPFNWIGPKQDNVLNYASGSSRVVSQFISNIMHGKDIQLVGGGKQHRSFTYIDDGISALMKIIENKDNCASSRIFNIGNPDNDMCIRKLAEIILEMAKTYPDYQEKAKTINIVSVSADEYYGKNYQDVQKRVPSIENAKQYLGWSPKFDIKTALRKTLDYYLSPHPC